MRRASRGWVLVLAIVLPASWSSGCDPIMSREEEALEHLVVTALDGTSSSEQARDSLCHDSKLDVEVVRFSNGRTIRRWRVSGPRERLEAFESLRFTQFHNDTLPPNNREFWRLGIRDLRDGTFATITYQAYPGDSAACVRPYSGAGISSVTSPSMFFAWVRAHGL